MLSVQLSPWSSDGFHIVLGIEYELGLMVVAEVVIRAVSANIKHVLLIIFLSQGPRDTGAIGPLINSFGSVDNTNLNIVPRVFIVFVALDDVITGNGLNVVIVWVKVLVDPTTIF